MSSTTIQTAIQDRWHPRFLSLNLAARKLAIALAHLGLGALTYYLSFQFRFDFAPDPSMRALLKTTILVALAVKLATFIWCGLLRGWWRYAGMSDLLDIAKAAFVSAFALYLLIPNWLASGLGYPRSVIAIDCLLTIVALGGARFAVRAYTEVVRRSAATKNTLVIGGGTDAANLIRELRADDSLGYDPVAVIDDDPTRTGVKIQGVKVVGTSEDLDRMVEKYAINCILIALPNSSATEIQRIVEKCQSCKVEFKILPSLGNRINGGNRISNIRKVKVEDLLGRRPVCLDVQAIRTKLHDKVVLITGAGGSIGSELARQVASFGPRRLVVLDRCENDQFKLSMELAKDFPAVEHVPVIGDILDVSLLRDVFSFYRPHSVFHAAAYKHVPMMEQNCFQALTNNVFGTYNVALMAGQFEAEDFVMISTDKAVRPTNVMGVTKRIAELVILSLQRHRTKFVAVRFGNVLGSNGSVLPIFEQQIAQGGPVTVTDPDARRYFMTIPEAVQLVLQASTMGAGGEIFVLDMGEPVRIIELANNLIRLSGLQPNKDVRVVFTGLRPGEKLTEELALDIEGTKPTRHEKIRVLDGGYFEFEQVREFLDELSEMASAKNMTGLIATFQKIVPEYKPSPQVLSRCALDSHDLALRYCIARTRLNSYTAALGRGA